MDIGEPAGKTNEHENKKESSFQRFKQWLDTKKLWVNIKGQKDEPKFWIELLGIFGLAAYVVIAFCQWQAQINALRIDQRAWLTAVIDPSQVAVSQPIHLLAHVSNHGKTPARHVDGWVSATIVRSDEAFGFPAHHIPISQFGTDMFFTGGIPIDVDITVFRQGETDVTKPLIVTNQMLEDYKNRKVSIIEYGKMGYDDYFGVKHWMQFCNMIQITPTPRKPASLQGCIDYNQMDDNK
jgi:hypothetical protein